MEKIYDFGMMGIGVMGSNLLLNIADKGFSVIGCDLNQERAAQLEAAATPGSVVKGTTDIQLFLSTLKLPRKIMMLVPAGAPVDSVINTLLPLLDQGDILIDGGNSFYKDTQRRVAFLQEKGIHFFGMGVSGGEAGARYGPSMMPGGDKEAWEYLRPVLESIAARSGETPCVAYVGQGAAGHYVKMVHNGIEYAMMQMISEVYDLLHRGAGMSNEALAALFEEWDKGPLQSYLVEITASVLATVDDKVPGAWLVDNILDQAGSKGTGKWTSQEAMDLPVALPSIDMAVAMRNLSVYKEQRVAAARLYQPKVGKVDHGDTFLATARDALSFSFLMAYAQGLSMLAKASTELSMNIPLPSVVQVWRAGCIIRSALLGNFGDAYAKEAALPNILLDSNIATLAKKWEEGARKFVAAATGARIPVGAIGSALSYFDAYVSERLPLNLVQAQRDFFGAHTYRRTDREGVFHTEWNE